MREEWKRTGLGGGEGLRTLGAKPDLLSYRYV